ncbi:MAG: hypothetical protein U1F37_03705 [Alphaproteobacteria bacterium]
MSVPGVGREVDVVLVAGSRRFDDDRVQLDVERAGGIARNEDAVALHRVLGDRRAERLARDREDIGARGAGADEVLVDRGGVGAVDEADGVVAEPVEIVVPDLDDRRGAVLAADLEAGGEAGLAARAGLVIAVDDVAKKLIVPDTPRSWNAMSSLPGAVVPVVPSTALRRTLTLTASAT